MDGVTDMLARDLVSHELGDRPVFELLHRLEHILDLDLVTVMDRERVVEAGHSEELL